MLDGQVLGASQVEYEPFGKTPLKREVPGRFLVGRVVEKRKFFSLALDVDCHEFAMDVF